MRKIVYIVKTKLHYYPPCVSQIRMINDLGWDIEVLYGTSEQSALTLLNSENIKTTKIGNISDKNNTMLKKIISWVKFRNSLNKKLKEYSKDTIFWFGTAESILPMKGKLRAKKYIVSLLELIDESKLKRKLLQNMVKNAQAVTVCEETRGYIMKNWWKLDKLPFVFPNKPYNQITDKNHKPSIPITKKIIEIIKEKKVILYQGIIQNSEEIEEVAKALKTMKNEYLLVLMGIDKYNSVEKIKRIYKNTLYVEYIPAPYHLEITSYARIGITYYRPDSLNKVFCAPNKIYEYSGFGIPIIANDIPGLKNTVGINKVAECIELKEKNIIEAIEKIEKNYNQYSRNAKHFFEETDNLKTMKKILESVKD